MEENKVKNMINLINNNNENLELNRIKNTDSNSLIKDNLSRKREDSYISTHSFSSIDSSINNTFESIPFHEEKDLDLPYFSSTKYNALVWRIFHSICYFLYCIILLCGTISFIKESNNYNKLMLVSHIFFFISSFLQWFNFKRGCIGQSNYNSGIKRNIDRSSKAKLLRSEEGWKHFFSLIACVLLIYSNIYKFIFDEKDTEFWNINLIGSMIISLSQILKLEKILTQNKQYNVKNDLSNCIIEIFLFFGSLFFGTSYYIQIMYNYDEDSFNKFTNILKVIGNCFIAFSGLSLIHRYFFSDYDDLNTSDISNITI